MSAASPFFIVGFQRSGTTLLRVMLDNHPDIAIPLDTTGLWDRFEKRLDRYGHLDSGDNREKLVGEILQEERIRLWEAPITATEVLGRWRGSQFGDLVDAFYQSYAASRGKSVWGDKDPGNMTRIDQLNRWFPTSRFIHIIRDGRDACLSHLNQSFGFDNLLECASAWREEIQWVRRMGGLLGPRYLEVKYEDLVAQPEGCLRAICGHLEIPYSEMMLRYPENVSRSVPDSKRHIWPLLDQAPRADNAGRWKSQLTPAQRVCFEKRAAAVLADLGYEVLPSASGGYLEEVRNMGIKAWKAVKRRLHARGPEVTS